VKKGMMLEFDCSIENAQARELIEVLRAHWPWLRSFLVVRFA